MLRNLSLFLVLLLLIVASPAWADDGTPDDTGYGISVSLDATVDVVFASAPSLDATVDVDMRFASEYLHPPDTIISAKINNKTTLLSNRYINENELAFMQRKHVVMSC